MNGETKYQVFRTGLATTADDPNRGVWYSNRCTFWTDNWLALARVGPGIPACPHCQAVGFHMTAADWDRGIADFAILNPGYAGYVAELKEKCHGAGVLPTTLWDKTIAARAAAG